MRGKAEALEVVFYQRKPRGSGNFSVEFIFDDVRRRLGDRIRARVRTAPYLSNGFFRRLAICADAWRRQGEVNHVTGDINFAAIGMSPRRTLLTILDCGFLADRRGWKRQVLKWLWVSFPVRRAALVTTISQSVRDEIVRLTGCPLDKVRVIPVAVSEAFRRVDRPFARTRPRILQVGTAPNKNLPRRIRALEGIACTLVVIGQLDDSCHDLIARCGIDVESHVNLPLSEIVRQYEAADIVTFVSTYEGFGMPIVEANVVGRPVVTSNVSSMPEVAAEAACLVDPLSVESIRAGILRVCSDENYRHELVRRGFENAQRFRPDAIANQYLELYCEVAGRGQPARLQVSGEGPVRIARDAESVVASR